MDRSYSASETARLLGTNVPRVLRATDRLGLQARPGRGVRTALTGAHVARLRDHLGAVAPAPGLSRVETQVLAALARAPRGLLSARSAARRAGVSPTAAARTLPALEERRLVSRERQMAALGRAREVEVWRASFGTAEWAQLAPHLALVRTPAPVSARRARRVPPELGHLFWNTAGSQLDLDRAGGYIARRLIQTGDLDGLAWGAEHLAAEDWRHAAATRGLDPAMKALALNLAAASAGLVSKTTLRFPEAATERPQRLLEQPAAVAEPQGPGDLMAMKLKVIAQRGELRDYFDLIAIEERTGHTVEEGLGYFLARFQPADPKNQVMAVIRALGYFEDVDEDELLPGGKIDIARYWQRRQPEILKSAGWLTTGGAPPAPPDAPLGFAD